ncbi:zinc finger BED domain-containing protein RICESLEEPER 1-like [Pistacia vera]|uniref:zinc finger BED domain-containing protein RICESLEEPER 1-like n=1 Tax=Pistacia vera TaxID=55513 RepID=UPI0012638298|nr:zinc finger BED domain-containing protein RICESLEEPER 1-like [Pistacia vera]
MEARTMEFDPQLYLYFQVGKETISEGMKRLRNLAHWYNSIPEKAGLFDEIITYLQSLQQQIKEIESLAQRGEAHVSSNINTTDLHHGQEITQIREQNKEIEMVMNKDVENSSCSKRKRRSKVWEDFTYSVGKDGKEWAQCNHCKRKFDGSSKSGTTHLKNHLKSCPVLKNPSGVSDKAKEKSVIDLELNGSDLLQKIIKYRLECIKDDILNVYQEEKDKLRGYLDKLPCRLNVTIQRDDFGGWSMKIWFINDSWELKNWIICFGEYNHDFVESVKSWLVDWNIDKKISAIRVGHFDDFEEKEEENICNWLNERGSLSFTGICLSVSSLLQRIKIDIHLIWLANNLRQDISTKLDKLSDYVRTNEIKFQSAIEKAVSMGKTVTSEPAPPSRVGRKYVIEWAMRCKEAFCVLEDIDPDFKSINFIKEDWDETTLLYNSWKMLNDWRKDVDNLLYPKHKTANEYFPMICQIFSKLVQMGKSDNRYICDIASHFRNNFDECWNNSKLVLVTTVILDPRFKMDFIVEKFYKEMYGNDANACRSKIIDDITNIFNKYAKKTNNSMSSSSQESELNCYLSDSKCHSDEGFDILKWWRLNSSTYPTLVRMARDFLSIPIFVIDEDDSFSDEVTNVHDCLKNLNDDDDFKCKFACTRFWLNNLENN